MSMIFPPDYRWSKRRDLDAIRATAARLKRELDAKDRRAAQCQAATRQPDLFDYAAAVERKPNNKAA